MQKETALIRDLLIFIAVMFALCIVLIVVISMLSNDNPLKRILTLELPDRCDAGSGDDCSRRANSRT
jgi:hypothetical protein